MNEHDEYLRPRGLYSANPKWVWAGLGIWAALLAGIALLARACA